MTFWADMFVAQSPTVGPGFFEKLALGPPDLTLDYVSTLVVTSDVLAVVFWVVV
jgi:hypothetical protein